MRVILLSSGLYLLGVVLILYFKPTFMFDKNGNWKEFAFTMNESHTWFPFWLFCILWAFISFFIINFFFGKRSNIKTMKPTDTAKPGIYVLDKEATKSDGFPRYVYLGPNLPSDIRDE